MIKTSKIMLTGAITVSVTLHISGLQAFYSDEPIQIEGGAAAAVEARLGNSFADMSTGTLTASETAEITPQELPVEATPVEQTPTEVIKAETTPTETLKAEPLPEAIQPVAQAVPVQPLAATETPTIAAMTPELAKPVEQPELETLAAVDPQVIEESPRPPKREKPVEPKPTPPKKEAAPKPQAKGNADQNARAGNATGNDKQTAAAQQSGQSRQATASGNAAASNYPGKIMREISRVPRPRVGVRASALVRFSVDGNGKLSSLSLAQSSGSERLDQAALKVVRRAAPFPPPPPGAQQSFSIKIESRG